MPRDLELKLVVPVTVHPDIFAWGAQCLRSSIATTHPDVKADVVDLRYCEDFVEIWVDLRSKLEHDVNQAMRSGYLGLKQAAPNSVYANERTFYYLAVFLMIAEDRPPLPAAFGELARLVERRGGEARAALARMDAVLRALLRPATNAELVVGISTYQYILLDALLLARRIRAIFPEVKLLLGGDPFDTPTAREAVKHTWLDGCVIGPGEYALREILEAVKTGADLRSTFIPRLANRAFFADSEANLQKWNTILDTRADYDGIKGYHGVEWNAATKAIHILGRRGCAWAICTFCQRIHVIAKEPVFDPSTSSMQQEIARLLEEYHAGRLGTDARGAMASRGLYQSGRFVRVQDTSRQAPLLIRVDADDADVPAVIALVAWLKEHIPEGQRVIFRSYAPVRQLARPEAHGLLNAVDPRRMELRLGVPIETLNPKTTRTMKKGSHPVDAIKAMKLAADCDASYGSSYFLFYPLETLPDVQAECAYIDRALHLLAGRYDPNIYRGSYRDPIGQAPADYQIVLDTQDDPLMALLGMKLRPDSTREYTVLGDTPLARMQNNYLAIFRTLREALLVRRWQRLRTLASLAKLLPGWFWWMARLRNFSYLRRAFLMLVVMIMPPGRIKLYLRDGEVIRERPWMLGGSWRKKLSELELRMLRYLYHQRQVGDLLSEFKDHPNVRNVLDEFLRLGLAVQHGNLVLSVVTDPEGLRQALEEEDLARSRRVQERKSDGQGSVHPGRKQKGKISKGMV